VDTHVGTVLSPEEEMQFALRAFKEFPEEKEVRDVLLQGLCRQASWGDLECDIATQLLQTGGAEGLDQHYLDKAPYDKKAAWNECHQSILQQHPGWAAGNSTRLWRLAAAYEKAGQSDRALVILEDLRRQTSDPAEQRGVAERILRSLPKVQDPDHVRRLIVELKPACFGDLGLALALKDLCLQCRIPAAEAIEIFEKWEALLEAEDPNARGWRTIEDKSSLLRVYVQARSVEESLAVLRYCSRLENLPLRVDINDAVSRVLGLFEEALKTLGKVPSLLLEQGDFCLNLNQLPDALRAYGNLRRAGGDPLIVCERLGKLITQFEKYENLRRDYLATYLEAYAELARLLVDVGRLDEAEAAVRKVQGYFLQIDETQGTRQIKKAQECANAKQVAALRLVFRDILGALTRRNPKDVDRREELALLAYSDRDWNLASAVYRELIGLYLPRPDAAARLQGLFHYLFWSYYCRGPGYHESMLAVIDRFIFENRWRDEVGLDILQELCALGYHELAVAERTPSGTRARRFREKAERYYEKLIGLPTVILQSRDEYLHKLKKMLEDGDPKLPFHYLKYEYGRPVPYVIPLESVRYGEEAKEGDYRAERLISNMGGFGEVWYREYFENGQWVPRACKFLYRQIPNEDMEKVRREFEQEGQLMKELHHPNIVQCFDCGFEQKGQYLKMEYVPGTDLQQFIDQEGRITGLTGKLVVFVGICAGIQYLHCQGARGIVHRDLHPRNILVGGTDGETIKVTDFGLARVLDEEGVAKSASVRGRPDYIPPETFRETGREPYTKRGDVYSLGRILCFMLKGYPTAVPEEIREVAGESLAVVCGRAAAADPRQRYRSVLDLLRDIAAACPNLPEVVDAVNRALDGIGGPRPTTVAELESRYTRLDGRDFASLFEELRGRDFVQVDAHDATGSIVSIKFINTHENKGMQIIERLESLHQIAELRHPNIEQVLAHNALAGLPFYYVLHVRIPGLSLADLLAASEKLDAETGNVLLSASFAFQVGVQVAEALVEAHRRELVHRMLSPSAIMVDLEEGRCVLADFSAAVLKGRHQLGRTAVLLGVEHFLAPEARGDLQRPIEARTDLYSLGATVISILLGNKEQHPLLTGREKVALATRHGVTVQQMESATDCLGRVTSHFPEDRGFLTAEDFKRALVEAAASLGVAVTHTDWKGIAGELAGQG
jgi:serine/threonine protein kinase/tetratricopeptide (TPR) repeat protein